MGPYEFSDLSVLDVDQDGLSDKFELDHVGNVGNVIDFVAGSDNDGDGLTALAEFVHGLDPNMPLIEPVGRLSMTTHNDQDYLTVTYRDTDTLYRDLTGAGARNCLSGRKKTLTGKQRFRAMEGVLENAMNDDLLSITLELVYGHAWAGGPRLPPGEFRVDPTLISRRGHA